MFMKRMIVNTGVISLANSIPNVEINPFESSVPFLYPLKTSGNLWFSNVFRGQRNEKLS